MAMGNSSAVMATRNSEMPSTPRYHEMSSAPNQDSLLVNWKPAFALPVLNATTIQATNAQLDHPGSKREPLCKRRSKRCRHEGDRAGRSCGQEDDHVQDREAHVQLPVRKVR